MQDILGNSLTADTNEEIEAVSGKIILNPKNKDALQLNNIACFGLNARRKHILYKCGFNSI